MRVGILGTGGMGGRHATHLKKLPGVELAAFDSDGGRLATFCATHGATALASAEAIFDWADLVDICTPTDSHASLGLASLRAGKPTLLEKPLARTIEECEALLEASKQNRVPLGTAQVVRFFPDYRQAHDVVQAGVIGKPAALRLRRGGGMPAGWFGDYARSGGVLLDLAVHEFDWLLWILGPCTQVYSQAAQMGASAGTHTSGADYALTTLTFANGAIAHVEATWMDPGGGRSTLEIAGSEGLIEYDSRQNPTLRTSLANGSRAESPNHPDQDPYFMQMKGFVEAVQNGTAFPVTGREGANATAIALAAIESAQTDRPVAPRFFAEESP